MVSRNKKIFIIIGIILFVIIAITGAVLGVLYMKTDFLKSERELFAKYITQNIGVFQELQSTSMPTAYNNIKSNDRYESNTNIKVEHSKGGEVSNQINNLKLQINSQKDGETEYLYTDSQILFNDEEYLRIELIKEQEKYGIRFSDAIKQFLTIKYDENLETVSNDLEIDSNMAYDFKDMMDGKNLISQKIPKEQIIEIQNKYLNMLMQKMDSVGTYSKLKDTMITVNKQTIESNSYSISLSKEQFKNIVIEILNELKKDEDIKNILIKFYVANKIDVDNPFTKMIDNVIKQIEENKEFYNLKVTVYETNGVTVRTNIEMGANNITIENSSEDGTTKVKIQNKVLNSEKVNEKNIEIRKTKNENKENYEAIIDITKGEEKQSITITSELQENADNVKMNTKMMHMKGITTISIIVDNNIKTADAIQHAVKLEEPTTNVILNDLSEEIRKKIINIVREDTTKRITNRIELIKQRLGINSENPGEGEGNPDENKISEVEINRFNAKFEFYTGEKVTSDNVRTLLGVVKSNIKSVEFPIITSEGEGLKTNDLVNIKLNIEKDVENEELINTVLEKIKNNRKYKVQITYNDSNGMIDYITINEVK